MEYYSAPQNNETTPFAATWMALESFILRQKEKYKYHIASIYTWNLNMTQTMKQTQRHREQTCGCQEGRGGEGMEWQFGRKLL